MRSDVFQSLSLAPQPVSAVDFSWKQMFLLLVLKDCKLSCAVGLGHVSAAAAFVLCFKPPEVAFRWCCGGLCGEVKCSTLVLDFLLQAESGPVFRNCAFLSPLEFCNNCRGVTNDKDPLWLDFGASTAKIFL